MKRIISCLTILCLLVGLSSTLVFATEYKIEIHDFKELHEYIVKNYYEDIQQNIDGTIEIPNLNLPFVNKDMLNEYYEDIKLINKGVLNGILRFGNSLEIELVPLEERAEIIYDITDNSDLKVPLIDPDEPPIFDLARKCYANVNELESLYETLLAAMKYDPLIIPWLETAVHFALNVRPNGKWDYKVDIGWDQYRTVVIAGKRYYIDGEDIGNIHYGYVGRYLFDSETLQYAAGVIQRLQGRAKPSWIDSYYDDPKDNAAIRRGINWYNSGTFR